MMISCCRIGFALALSVLLPASLAAAQEAPIRFPQDNAADINPDTHLVLTFKTPPKIGTSGKIKILDASNDKLIDTLDLAIPAGPANAGGARGGRGVPARGAPASAPATGAASAPAARGAAATYTPVPYDYSDPIHHTNANTVPGTPSGVAVATPTNDQLTIIGGFTDAFHFYPIIVHDNIATIYPHNNLLEYNKKYYVQIDPGALAVADNSFSGIGEKSWTFTTKKSAPPANASRLVVAADGSGDFNTVQGALDFIPDHTQNRTTVFIRNGIYEEIVYFRNKSNITLLGEDRDKVQVFYANNEVFNPHPANVLTNEYPGTFPSRRAAFMGDHSTGIQLINFTVKTTAYGQAEGLLLAGGQNLLSNVNITGSGDALQMNDSTYFIDSTITGDGDSILTRGPAFFEHCDLHSGGVFMWVRSTAASHGLVFNHCTFKPTRTPGPTLARAPANNGKGYPDAEVVLLNCLLDNIDPAGWGPVGGETANMHYWEYNSTNLSDGKSVDTSKRLAMSKQLDKEKDAKTITDYSNPAFVLGGWTPTLAPLILKQPESAQALPGQTLTLVVTATAVPAPTYQWQKNGVPIQGATDPALQLTKLQPADSASYTVTISNAQGTATSNAAALTVR